MSDLHRDNAAEMLMRLAQRIANAAVKAWYFVGATYMSPENAEAPATGDMYVAPTKDR